MAVTGSFRDFCSVEEEKDELFSIVSCSRCAATLGDFTLDQTIFSRRFVSVTKTDKNAYRVEI